MGLADTREVRCEGEGGLRTVRFLVALGGVCLDPDGPLRSFWARPVRDPERNPLQWYNQLVASLLFI